ncbi:hypothetical protein CVT23_00125 [Minwuia thermotolerans]|uniref:TauD/TfdA-like domain-containing protein n=2 Tax=Minwuia thermotolerans TaxID=2056226 RepID=A0A2M9G7Q5_9PROT|nr:hypothetical protein CVT23_00125 [Minwuia thermotolerans]
MAAHTERWLEHWSDEEITEIESAVAHFEARDVDLLDMRASHYVAPQALQRVMRIRNDVLHGRGFALLRGLPVERWTIRQAAIAYWGMGLHMGEPCSQNGKGHVLGHVKNLGLDYGDAGTRGYQTNARLPFHTDGSDIVGLLCWRSGKAGGLSSLTSSTAVFNRLALRRPDLARVLMQPFCLTRWGEVPEGRKPWSEAPVFMSHGGRMIARYVRSAIHKGQDLAGVPKLTAQQIEALDMLDEITKEPDMVLDMEFLPGDIQFVCNYNVFHSRTAFEDWPETERKRHLLRLWLACDDGPDLPDVLIQNCEGQTAGGRPNGIAVPGVPFAAPLEAA